MKEARESADGYARCCRRSEAQLRRLNRAHRALSTTKLRHSSAPRTTASCSRRSAGRSSRSPGTACAGSAAPRTTRPRPCDPSRTPARSEATLKIVAVTWADSDRGRGPVGTAIRMGRPSSSAGRRDRTEDVPPLARGGRGARLRLDDRPAAPRRRPRVRRARHLRSREGRLRRGRGATPSSIWPTTWRTASTALRTRAYVAAERARFASRLRSCRSARRRRRPLRAPITPSASPTAIRN